jgi:hypothetical protein
MITSTDPRTGSTLAELDLGTTPTDLARICEDATAAAVELRDPGPCRAGGDAAVDGGGRETFRNLLETLTRRDRLS